VGEVVVAVVGEAELQDLAADVLWQGAFAVVGRGFAVPSDGGAGRGALVVGEPGDGVGVVVDADEDAVGGVGGARARAEAERGEVAGLAVAASAHGVHRRRQRGGAQADGVEKSWGLVVRGFGVSPWTLGRRRRRHGPQATLRAAGKTPPEIFL